MLRFESPAFLYAVPLLLLLGALAYWQLGRLSAKHARLADAHLLPGLGVGEGLVRRKRLRALAAVLALLLWTVALANPQFGTRTRLAEARNTELVIALDISRSMLAGDVAPSRLQRAQLFLSDLLSELGGERVGLILYAGQAYLQMPLTNDYAAAVDVLRSANPGQAPTQGTNLAAALGLAHRLLIRPQPEDAPPPPPVRRVVLVVSDGENHEPGAVAAAETSADAGVRTLTIGVGTTEGALVPSDDPRDRGYARDEDNEPVVSQFDAAALREIAEVGEGQYYSLVGNTRELAREVAAYLDGANLGGTVEERFEEKASYYQLLVGLGLGALGWAWWLGRRPPPTPASATYQRPSTTSPTEPLPHPS